MIGEESIATTDKMDYSDIKRACKDRSEYSCEEFCRRMEALPRGHHPDGRFCLRGPSGLRPGANRRRGRVEYALRRR